MRKEFGKWLMDIAKYITTAVILTSIFGEIDQKWIIYVGGIISILLTLGIGLWLVQDKKRKENNMGALIMFGFVSLIAIVGGIYFYLEDKKEIHSR